MADRIDAAWNTAQPSRPARSFYAVARGLLVGGCYAWFRLEVDGRERVPGSGPFILAPVHRSNLDTPIVASVTRRPLRFMGKDSLWRANTLFSWVLSALGGFPVHRDSADREALRRCEAVLRAGQPLVLYPEGSRRSGPIVEGVKDGPAFLALRTGTPIVPVGIGGSERAQPKGRRLIRPVKVHVVVGEPLVPAVRGEGRATSRRAVREFSEQLHGELQALFDEAQARLS
ncbi:MAG: 1-acyl-sn-glycerol-3-phosphate acyltransferase [Acidimicrobiia bacterium]|nr:1-acyl-sn-glycerol-3-phosphate acyltransferase [Acidimicrobiia bacterium]